MDNLRLRSNCAYQRSKDKETHDLVPDAPGLQFYANIYWEFFPEWSLDTQYSWIGNRHRAPEDTRPEIPDNDWVNLNLRRKGIMKNLDVSLKVSNLFDEDIREPSLSSIPNDYPMEGRGIYGEVRLHF
jgi:iron complex outermembrane receptor protein